MGIVSFCPSGHRVKVKDHLAGKNGICPTCGAKFRIPLVSATSPARPRAAEAPSRNLPVAAVVSLDPELAATLPPVLPLAPAASPAAGRSLPEPVAPEPEPEEQEVDFLSADVLEPAAPPAAIAEARGATWSIAVPGGEASAPMSGEALLEWLTGGQVTGNELVWRSDWPEWRSVRQVFPEYVPNFPGIGFPSW